MIRLQRTWTAAIFVLLSGIGGRANAGPPLISDDPHTIGPGAVEAIIALEAFRLDEATSIAAPLLDLTVGLIEKLDATLVAAPLFEDVGGSSTSSSEFIEAGIKWQPLRTERWNASASPVVIVGDQIDGRVGFALPLQVEVSFDAVAIGIDSGFALFVDGSDGWHGNLYSTWSFPEGPTLMAEVWSAGRADRQQGEVATGLGIEWPAPHGLSFLGSAGAGIATWGSPRLDWYGYVGVKWAFRAW